MSKGTRLLAVTWSWGLLVASAFAGVPSWMLDASRTALGTYPADTRAVVLLDENVTTVRENGEVITSYRRVVKILSTKGRDFGTASVHYDTETKLSNFKAWSIAADGQQYEVKEKDALEITPYSGELYSDNRVKLIKIPAAEPGAIVGFEYEQKQRPYIWQDHWFFQEDVPVKKARYVLLLPGGWEYKMYWRNYSEQQPVAMGGSLVWELNDLPAVKTDEDYRPTLQAVAGRMYVSYFSTSGVGKQQTSWEGLGSWYNGLTADRRSPTTELQRKVQDLTAGKSTTLDKIRVLTAFAQRDVRYVAIEIGIGGQQPHRAGEIFANRYGDCKDKATVLSTMLKEIGIDSYYVIIDSHRGVVAKDIPTFAMNHAIIAIRMPDSVPTDASQLPALFQHETLGRLVIFDPTDDATPFGQLPPHLQDTYALLATPEKGDLIHIPLHVPETSRRQRVATLQLGLDGVLSGELREVRTGFLANRSRQSLIAMAANERVKYAERFLSGYLTGFKLKDFQVENLENYEKDLIFSIKFDAPNYAKNMGGMMLVRPRVVGTMVDASFDLKDRKYPVELDGTSAETDEFRITVPPGYMVDELPPAVAADIAPASYKSNSEFKDNVLTYRREYRVKQVMIPLDKLKELHGFYGMIAGDERSAAVLKRAQ
ncbi:MAG: DUF3857 and transglutaminase domain-containing protein [Acidobacteriales bacterium]|nr:DUF3857 and transglutaminase domain-containing protein [Terriglobales bacterium]